MSAEDRETIEAVIEALCEALGWDEIDGDGDEAPLLVSAVRSLADALDAANAENARAGEIAMRVKVIAESATVDEPVWLLPNKIIFALEPLLAAHRARIEDTQC